MHPSVHHRRHAPKSNVDPKTNTQPQPEPEPEDALLEVEGDARDLVGVLERQAQVLVEGIRALAHLFGVCVLLVGWWMCVGSV